ncbi:hypothetical protein [Shinella sp. DD12]|uniref:hypothetical protein n=1 Tax=Shinella sp. DD12 TaxID=1410620 RepID=UPI002795FA2A|nr:hypothetical protein [Shinella sp. DD12]
MMSGAVTRRKVCSGVAPFEACRLDQRRRDLLERGEVEDHEEAGLLPDRDDDQRPQRRGGRAEQVVVAEADKAEQLVDRPIARRIEEQPDIRDGDHRQHGWREVGHAHQALAVDPVVDEERHGKRQRH